MSLDLPPGLGLPMVYLVDDEDVVRDAVAWLLRSRRLLSQGHASAEAFEAALAGAEPGAWPNAPSCLLLDLRMGGMSGLALFERLVDRIELALAASAAALVARRERARRLRGLAELSEREQEVMALVARGLPNKRIADALELSVRTVEVHRAKVFDKLEVASAVELANLLHAARG
jgi:two-component system response regulator DctR